MADRDENDRARVEQEERARRLREKIKRVRDAAQKKEGVADEEGPPRPESPREFIERKMRELDDDDRE